MRKRRAGWLGLVGASVLLRAGHAFPAESAAASAATVPPAATDDGTFALGLVDWRLAPIRWSGTVGAGLRLSGGSNQPRRVQDLETVNLQGRSYIWQPWFAQVSAGLGMVTSINRYSRGVADGSGGADRTRSSSATATGNAGLSLFPVSRFPFQVSYDVTDSRANGELIGSDFNSRRLSVRQNYRPQAGNTSYVLSYDRSTLDSTAFGRDTLRALTAGVTHAWNAQNIDVTASRTRNDRGNTGESALLSRINARHHYRPEGTLSIDTQASYSDSDLHLLNSGLVPGTQSRFLQLNTVGTWRPEAGHPLNVIGSARLFRSEFASAGSSTNANSLSANLAANYRWTPHTTLYGSVGLAQLRNDIESRILANQAAGITYTPNVIDIGAYKYTWNAGANLANQSGGVDGAQNNAGGNIGHTLLRSMPLNRAYTASVSAGQSYTLNEDSLRGLSQTVVHNATVSLRGAPTPDANAYISLTAADSRTYGANENSFQIINLQSSAQMQLSRHAFASANLTIQGTRQSTPERPARGFTFGSSGNLNYSHTRAFGVPQLRYSLLYGANQTQYASRLQGDINAPRDQVNQSLEQRLDYRVGRIEMRLSARIARTEGRDDWLLYFTINRRFGDF